MSYTLAVFYVLSTGGLVPIYSVESLTKVECEHRAYVETTMGEKALCFPVQEELTPEYAWLRYQDKHPKKMPVVLREAPPMKAGYTDYRVTTLRSRDGQIVQNGEHIVPWNYVPTPKGE